MAAEFCEVCGIEYAPDALVDMGAAAVSPNAPPSGASTVQTLAKTPRVMSGVAGGPADIPGGMG